MHAQGHSKKRSVGISSIALFVGSDLLLVLGALLIVYLLDPNRLPGMETDANVLLGALIYIGFPLFISGDVIYLIRQALAISRRTGITFSAILGRGSLLIVLFGVFALWHPVIQISSEGTIGWLVLIAGILLLISGGLSFLIALTMSIWEGDLHTFL